MKLLSMHELLRDAQAQERWNTRTPILPPLRSITSGFSTLITQLPPQPVVDGCKKRGHDHMMMEEGEDRRQRLQLLWWERQQQRQQEEETRHPSPPPRPPIASEPAKEATVQPSRWKQTGHGKCCSVEGCNCRAQHRGLCWKHGGYTICTVDGCMKRAKSRGICWSHGGGTKCHEPDCTKIAVSRGLCWAHGGGKRCQLEGCKKPAAERTQNYCNDHYLEVILQQTRMHTH